LFFQGKREKSEFWPWSGHAWSFPNEKLWLRIEIREIFPAKKGRMRQVEAGLPLASRFMKKTATRLITSM
jgi:hypothetical protein